jgi:hypothetical protein
VNVENRTPSPSFSLPDRVKLPLDHRASPLVGYQIDMNLDMNHYLDATTQATRRARGTILILVTASVLIFASLLNSLKHEWTRQRLERIGKEPYGVYVNDLIGPRKDGDAERKQRYEALYTAAVREFVDTAFIVHVPLLGFSFDVNDLGLVGGSGFIVLLSMLLFSLKRELSNLITSFGEAKRQHQLRVFYDLLAMEQVLTVPEGLQIPRSLFLRVVPKVILCIPAAVYLCRWARYNNHWRRRQNQSSSYQIALRRRSYFWDVNPWANLERDKRGEGGRQDVG